MVNKTERIASLVILAVSCLYTLGAFLIPQPPIQAQLGPDAFPKTVGLIMILLSGIYVFQMFAGKAKEDEERAAIIGADEKVEGKVDFKLMGIMLGLMVAYALLFERLGYAITTFLVFMAGVWFMNRKHLVRDAIIAFIASFVLYFVFSLVLRVRLPAGPFYFLGF